jgi:hypothetical protein
MPRSNNICNGFPSSRAARFRLLCAILLYARMPSNRPGGNVTGVTIFGTDAVAKANAATTGGRSKGQGKADMTFCGNPLSRSLLGVKRTWLVAAHMSAFDPKRTCGLNKRRKSETRLSRTQTIPVLFKLMELRFPSFTRTSAQALRSRFIRSVIRHRRH